MCLRSGSGMRFSPDLPAPDLRWLGFLYELGDLAGGGVDIRERVFAADGFQAAA